MKLGIVGLPNIGKSTLFNALTKAHAEASNYPFCTIDPNIGTVAIPDPRLKVLEKIYGPQKVVPATIDFVDIAGLVKGASRGEGLGNKFLSYIREVEAILHIVRCFHSPEVIHVENSVDPIRDIETINTELILADLETVQKRLERSEKQLRTMKDKDTEAEYEFLKKMLSHLSDGRTAKTMKMTEDEKKIAAGTLYLLTAKPVIYVANVDENDIANDIWNDPVIKKIKEYADKDHSEVVIVSAKVEEEIAQLGDEERAEFLKQMGFEESGLERLIHASYKLLGLFSFLTGGKQEVRAWTAPFGTRAPQAAGKIHTDFEKGFISAEVVNYDDLVKYGSMNAAKENGKVRIEGKDYIMQEGDVVLFRFNV